MELEETFRNIITGKYDPNTDYNGLEFSFKTVCQMFPGPQYTLYRGCPCSIEHEFMLYWKTAAIDIDILNRVAQNITNGKCPHVEETTPAVFSNVYGIYIAAAVNTEMAILKHAEDLRPRGITYYDTACGYLFESGVFKVRPHQIAIMKDSQKTYSAYLEKLYNRPHCIDLSQRNVCYIDTSEVPKSETCSLKVCMLTDLELCVMVKNLQAFSLIARGNFRYKEIYNVLVASTADGDLNLLITVQKYIQWLFERDKFMTHLFCRLHNRIKVSLKHPATLRLIYGTEHSLKRQLLKSFDTECNKLLKTGLKAKSNRNKIIINSLKNREKEFIEVLQSNEVLMKSLHASTSTYAILHACVSFADNVGLKYLLDLGYCIDGLDQDGRTLLGYCIGHIGDLMLISSIQTGSRRLRTLELLIYENSSLRLNKSVVASAIQNEIILKSYQDYHRNNEFSLYHDWMQDPLFFPAALLIECGFPVTRDVLLMALDYDLHPAELDYLRACLDGPRRLTHMCRDVIRMSFKGRSLHTFIETSKIPSKVKDFILIRWLLDHRMPQ